MSWHLNSTVFKTLLATAREIKKFVIFSKASKVRFQYLETLGVSKWEKTKEKGDAAYEASTCFMARDDSEQYLSQIHRPLEH